MPTFWLLYRKWRLLKWRLKYICPVILHSIPWNYYCWLVLSISIFQLSCFVIKILPDHISWFLPISLFNTLMSLYYWQFLFFKCLLFLHKGCHTFSSLLNHLQKIIYSMLSYWSLLWIVLKSQHFTDNCLLKNLYWLQSCSHLFKVCAVHLL